MRIPITFFAPPGRKPIEVIQRQADSFKRSPLSQTFLNAGVNYLFVLNAQRQIVMASENVLEFVRDKTLHQIIGLRPGEALGCIHAYECRSGCGTSRFCRCCHAVQVILNGLAGARDIEECRLTCLVKGRETVLRLQVLATPLVHDGERYTLLTVADMDCTG